METEGPGLFITLFAFIGGFGALVFIHEWGHYSVARLFGIRVETFSIGFGREIFGYTARSGTRWKFSLLPLGGYVKFFGDKSGASNPDTNDLAVLTEAEKAVCFHYKPVWQRALVVAAGPVINLLAAVIVFAGFYFSYGVQVSPATIADIQEGSPAAASQLLAGDTILSLNGTKTESFSDIRALVQLLPGQQINLLVERSGAILPISMQLGTSFFEDRFGNKYPYGQMGIISLPPERKELGILQATAQGAEQTKAVINTIFTTLGQMIVGLRSVSEVGGPLRIVDMTGTAAEQGIENLVWFLAMISVNLGVVNLLPIPVLDGGHLMFYLVEAVKGSPLSQKAQEAGFMAGFAVMIIFMVFVTLNDLQSMAL